MPYNPEAVSRLTVTLPRFALARMIRLVRDLYRISRMPAYRQRIESELPEAARFNPGHDSVMMGYDFHLTEGGPKLIEVNTNAGGGLFAFLAHRPDAALAEAELSRRLEAELKGSFAEEMQAFSRGKRLAPQFVAIVDEKPKEQFLYPEMEAFTRLFGQSGCRAVIADPAELVAGEGGVFFDGEKVDLVYNRHCDFYLEGPQMAGIRAAYLARQVCLTPNPFTYGLLGDKRRMVLWSDPVVLGELGVGAASARLLAETVPQSFLLDHLDRGQTWKTRKQWAFKPVSRFGSRGVLLGPKATRKRFDELPGEDTLVQELVPPSMTPGDEPGGEMKTDFRLYVYRTRILGVAARLYRGQVTNMRTPGGGFAPVRLI